MNDRIQKELDLAAEELDRKGYRDLADKVDFYNNRLTKTSSKRGTDLIRKALERIDEETDRRDGVTDRDTRRTSIRNRRSRRPSRRRVSVRSRTSRDDVRSRVSTRRVRPRPHSRVASRVREDPDRMSRSSRQLRIARLMRRRSR